MASERQVDGSLGLLLLSFGSARVSGVSAGASGGPEGNTVTGGGFVGEVWTEMVVVGGAVLWKWKFRLVSSAVSVRREWRGDLPKSCLREGRLAICWMRTSGSTGRYSGQVVKKELVSLGFSTVGGGGGRGGEGRFEEELAWWLGRVDVEDTLGLLIPRTGKVVVRAVFRESRGFEWTVDGSLGSEGLPFGERLPRPDADLLRIVSASCERP